MIRSLFISKLIISVTLSNMTSAAPLSVVLGFQKERKGKEVAAEVMFERVAENIVHQNAYKNYSLSGQLIKLWHPDTLEGSIFVTFKKRFSCKIISSGLGSLSNIFKCIIWGGIANNPVSSNTARQWVNTLRSWAPARIGYPGRVEEPIVIGTTVGQGPGRPVGLLREMARSSWPAKARMAQVLWTYLVQSHLR